MEKRCEFSDLFISQCAHCLGHVGEWEVVKRPKIYEGS